MPQRARPSTYVYFFAFFLILQFGIHVTLLTMPYFWDEIGSTVPAAQAAATNGLFHTPPVALYTATAWKLFGASAVTTRCAMLLLSAVTLLGVFLLAIELCGSLQGAPALVVAALMALSPWFFGQSILAQSPIPATLCAAYGLWFYLTGRRVLAAPFALAFLWILATTQPALGWFQLGPNHPPDFVVNAGRRAASLFLANLHFLATLGILLAWRAGRLQRTRWKIAGGAAAVYFLLLCLAGPPLERDLLPILPVFYTAAVVGFYSYAARWRMLLPVAMLCGFVASLWFAPPWWPDALENSLGMSEFSDLQRTVASYLDRKGHNQAIATAWPLSAELRQPGLGYVSRPLLVAKLPDFHADCLRGLQKGDIDIFVRYSQGWDPAGNLLLSTRATRFVARRFLGYHLSIEPEEIEQKLGLHLSATMQSRGHWVEIYTR